MKVLVVGSGGREHALCWRLAQSPRVEQVFCAPGNPGTAAIGQNVPIDVGQHAELVSFAEQRSIDLTVVGPEVPLCDGLADTFAAHGLLVAGPSKAAARLEGSKSFAKAFMQRHGIPTADSFICANTHEVTDALKRNPRALVVKADGLAAGKGVVVADDEQQVLEAAERHFAGGSGPLLLEQRLVGEEVSVIAVADGERFVLLASSQDHKAALDGDKGPNTGGMGAYSPAPVLTPELEARVAREVIAPTVAGMAAEGAPFQGVLYAGLMIVDGDPWVLEYNCRFGDPETQVLMARLRSDLAELLLGAARGQLPDSDLQWDPRPAVCVVLASDGYPGSYAKGVEIQWSGDADGDDPDLTVFHAGTARQGDQLVTAGGRVFGVTASGSDLGSAREKAYQRVRQLAWPGAHFRTDIGARGLA